MRELVGTKCYLDRWIDFKSFQVFEEATTYTALQFFTKTANKAVRVAEAPVGRIPENPWEDTSRALPYSKVVFGDRWLLLTGEERDLIDRLYQHCKPLEDSDHTKQIFQGLITSSDAIYHLTRKAPGRYLCSPKGDKAPPPYEVEIEDALMKPLVSGAEAKRYQVPATETYLLFPYTVDEKGAHLIDAKTMKATYPKAWAYLKSYKEELRLREAKRDRSGKLTDAPFDDEQWYRFGRHQNLDKQEITKLIVPRLVANLGCNVDPTGSFYLDNVDVGGIVVAERENPFFLAGILNSRTVNYVFKRISKPFRGNYLSANKQFIAPLPIPPASEKERDAVALRAKELQQLHTARRDLLLKIERRLSSVRFRNKPETWLFPGLKTKKDLEASAPTRLDLEKKREWANQRYELELTSRYEAISARLKPGASLSAFFKDGELSVCIDGVPVIERIFVDATEGEFIVAQWKVLCSTFSITEKTDGKKLANAFRSLAVADNGALVAQIIEREKKLSALEAGIVSKEREMDTLINRLFGLTEADIRLIDAE